MFILPDAKRKGISQSTVDRNKGRCFCCSCFRVRALMKFQIRDQQLQFTVSVVNNAGRHDAGCISYVGFQLCPVYGPLIFQLGIIRSDHVYIYRHGRVFRHYIVITFVILSAVDSKCLHRRGIVRKRLRPDTANVGIQSCNRHVRFRRGTGGIPYDWSTLSVWICVVRFACDRIDINTLEVSLPFCLLVCQEGTLFQFIKEDHISAYGAYFLNIADIVGVFSSDQGFILQLIIRIDLR